MIHQQQIFSMTVVLVKLLNLSKTTKILNIKKWSPVEYWKKSYLITMLVNSWQTRSIQQLKKIFLEDFSSNIFLHFHTFSIFGYFRKKLCLIQSNQIVLPYWISLMLFAFWNQRRRYILFPWILFQQYLGWTLKKKSRDSSFSGASKS